MTAEPPENPVTEAASSLEVRWIFPGQLEAAVAGWFARFPPRTESREDTYLLDPQLRGLSVKVRGGGVLEVKVYWRRCSAPGPPQVRDVLLGTSILDRVGAEAAAELAGVPARQGPR